MTQGASHIGKRVSLWAALAFGVGAILAIASPVWLGYATYFLAEYLGFPHPALWAQLVGWFVLLAVPTYILGKALRASYVSPSTAANTGEQQKWEDAEPVQNGIPTDQVIEAWKTAVQVQQHFNQLELQIRNFAVSLLAAVIGGSAFAVKEHYEIQMGGTAVSASVPILIAGVVGLLAFYFMDRFWYHNLLIGSVRQALKIEKRYRRSMPELGLTTIIGDESPQKVGRLQIHSSEKIDLFYSAGLTLLIILTGGMMLARHVPSETGVSTAPPQTQGPRTPAP